MGVLLRMNRPTCTVSLRGTTKCGALSCVGGWQALSFGGGGNQNADTLHPLSHAPSVWPVPTRNADGRLVSPRSAAFTRPVLLRSIIGGRSRHRQIDIDACLPCSFQFVDQLDLQINLCQISHAVNMVNYRIIWPSHTKSTRKENRDNHIIEKPNKVIILPL